MRTTDASVLRKANATMGTKVTFLDLIYGGSHEATKFLTLFLGDRRSQVLNFGGMFPDKNDQGYLGNSADPRIANQLRVEGQQAVGPFRVATCRRLPVNQATGAVNLTDGVKISYKLAASGKASQYFHLEIRLRIVDTNAIVLHKSLEQVDSLMQQAVPSLSLFIFGGSVAIDAPLFE